MRSQTRHITKLLIFLVVILITSILYNIHTQQTSLRHFSATLNNLSFDELIAEEGKDNLQQSNITLTGNNENQDGITKLKHITCENRHLEMHIDQRGHYIVLYNYVKAERNFACHESITFTAPADYTFLDNLSTLVDRWKGPISVALFAPGTDFGVTLKSIAYLRLCPVNSRAIREFVTFHLFFHHEHSPKPIKDSLLNVYEKSNFSALCGYAAPFKDARVKDTYRRQHKLLFPINVARNIARQSAQTHFVFAADIELYPSVGFIRKFLNMIGRHADLVQPKREHPRIFVLPVFEVESDVTLPGNKSALQVRLRLGTAQVFHKTICPACHSIPRFSAWENERETATLEVFAVSKRTGRHAMWEAFYVGTKADPLFDEHYSWEGQGNKMSQAFAMCLLNYDYMVLNNAFVVHKPGIKHTKEQVKSFSSEIQKSNSRLKKITKPMLYNLYGYRKGCQL